jgi:hypothetical protein
MKKASICSFVGPALSGCEDFVDRCRRGGTSSPPFWLDWIGTRVDQGSDLVKDGKAARGHFWYEAEHTSGNWI